MKSGSYASYRAAGALGEPCDATPEERHAWALQDAAETFAYHQHRCPACLMLWNCWAPLYTDERNEGTHDTGDCWACEEAGQEVA